MIEAIAALNRFPGCEKPICIHQKHMSMLIGSKVMTRYVAMAAIFDFFPQRQTHTVNFRGLLVCCIGGVRDAIQSFITPLFFPIKSYNFTVKYVLYLPDLQNNNTAP